MGTFFDMGGYAAYVWPAYGLATLVVIGLLVLSVRRLRAAQRMLTLLEQARRGRADNGPDA
ncbi:MAG: heme exporter protein CcmD [Pseudomonadota bacterium]